MREYIVNASGELGAALVVACAGAGYIREEIVRCKDCKRYIPQGTYHFADNSTNKDFCDVIRGYTVQINPDSFCAWGERKDNETSNN